MEKGEGSWAPLSPVRSASVTFSVASAGSAASATSGLVSPPLSSAAELEMERLPVGAHAFQYWGGVNSEKGEPLQACDMRVSIIGAIGAGKSTVLEAVEAQWHAAGGAEGTGFHLLLQTEGADDDSFLELLRGVEAGRIAVWEFQVQILKRHTEAQEQAFRQYAELRKRSPLPILHLTERSAVDAALVFIPVNVAVGKMTPAQQEVYLWLYGKLGWKPDAFVHILTEWEEAAARIATRNREGEQDTPVEYYRKVHAQYGAADTKAAFTAMGELHCERNDGGRTPEQTADGVYRFLQRRMKERAEAGVRA